MAKKPIIPLESILKLFSNTTAGGKVPRRSEPSGSQTRDEVSLRVPASPAFGERSSPAGASELDSSATAGADVKLNDSATAGADVKLNYSTTAGADLKLDESATAGDLILALNKFQSLVLDVLLTEISKPIYNSLKVYTLGSLSYGGLCPFSDIDLLVIGDKNLAQSLGSNLEIQLSNIKIKNWPNLDLELAQDIFDHVALSFIKPLSENSKSDLIDFYKKQKSCIRTNLEQYQHELSKDRRLRRSRYGSVGGELAPNLKYGPGGLRDTCQSMAWLKWQPKNSDNPMSLVDTYWRSLESNLSQIYQLRFALQVLFQTDQIALEHWSDLKTNHGISDFQKKSYYKILHEQFFITDLIFGNQTLSLNEDLNKLNLEVDFNDFSIESLSHLNEQNYRMYAFKLKSEVLFQSELKTDLNFKTKVYCWINDVFNNLNEEWQIDFILDSGFLELLLPEWNYICGLTQSDHYHKYTVSEHLRQTLKAVCALQTKTEIRHSLNSPCNQMSSEDWQILKWTAIFHDLKKGHPEDHSVLGKQAVDNFLFFQDQNAEGSLRRGTFPPPVTHPSSSTSAPPAKLLSSSLAPAGERRSPNAGLAGTFPPPAEPLSSAPSAGAFPPPRVIGCLVEHHLKLSTFAFRYEHSDQQQLESLNQLFEVSDWIRLLLIFTGADIMGSNPQAWNKWKADQLYFAYESLIDFRTKKINNDALIIEGFELSPQLVNVIGVELLKEDLILLQNENVELQPDQQWLVESIDENIWVRVYKRDFGPGTLSHILNILYIAGLPVEQAFIASGIPLKGKSTNNHESHNALDISQVTVPKVNSNGSSQAGSSTFVYNWFRLPTTFLKPKHQIQKRLNLLSKQKEFKNQNLFAKINKVVYLTENQGKLSFLFKGQDQNGVLLFISKIFESLGVNIQKAQINTWGKRIEDLFVVKKDSFNGEELKSDVQKLMKLPQSIKI